MYQSFEVSNYRCISKLTELPDEKSARQDTKRKERKARSQNINRV